MSKKKLVSILLSAVLCFGMLGSTFSASAAHVSVHLTKDQTVNSSSNVHGTFKYFWGNNSKSSLHRVYYIARYKKGAIWLTNISWPLKQGESISENTPLATSKFDKATDWFLKLNPEGSRATGCEAWGYMRNL